ncbi:MAG: CoA transferase [Chloroflexi bacterium]|nr:CoA transferase [Chloroflexota bacterium]MQC47955.1 CoA transferase [Chloroflexota bacterium]
MAAPLEGLRVLDLTRNVAGPYATKILADFGADVLKVEPPEGDPSRTFGPFPGDEPHPERSGLFLHLNTNKRSITLDVASETGAAEIRRLSAGVDVVIEDQPAGAAARWGWGWSTLSADHPELIMVSITPFGQTGPYRDYRGSEITLQAIGGPLHQTGHIEREPLKLGGHVAHFHAGLTAAFAILTAFRRVEGGGIGDYIDVSVYECQSGFRDRRTIALTAASYTGQAARRGGAVLRVGAGVRPCLDGYVNLQAGGVRLPLLLRLIGREDLIGHPGLANNAIAVPPDLADEIEASYLVYLLTRTKREVVAEAQALGILGGAILTIADLVQDPHYRDRGAWETIDHPHTGPVEYPGRPFIMSASPRPHPRRAPLLGEHNDEVLSHASTVPPGGDRAAAARSAAGDGPAPLPLAGIRVADITVVWAGPNVTQLLAEWGAEVIRVEPINRIQPSTRGAERIYTREQATAFAAQGQLLGAYPDFDPKDDPWNRVPAFNSHARNKKSMACDVMSPEGREAFLRLIERCDVFVENNVPVTIDKAGITYEELRQVNPRLVMLRMPAFGLSGPYRDYRAFGTHAEGMVGHHYLRGYTDADPSWTGEALTADGVNGVQGAVAVLMALRHRDRTGEGQQVELPLAEGFTPTLAEFILEYTMNQRDPLPQGNTHRWHAPHGIYPCSGEDEWIAIDVASDKEFRSLCDVLGQPALATDGRFATAEARRAALSDLDAAIGLLTRQQGKEALFHALQQAGVTAAPVRDELGALACPHLAERRWFREIEMSDVGTHRYPGYLFKMLRTPDDVRLPPCKLGEHNEEIYLDLLQYSRSEYERMVEAGLVGTGYRAKVLGRDEG